MAIDLLITNARVIPMTGPSTTASALAVEGGRVVFVGERAPEALASQAAETVDLQGRALLPGLVDAYAFASVRAAIAGELDLTAASSYSELEEALATCRRRGASRRVPLVLGGVRDRGLAEGQLPSRAWLDARESRRPVLVVSADGARVSANAAMLAGVRAAGVPLPDAPPDHAEVWTSPEAEVLLRWTVGRRRRRGQITALVRAGQAGLEDGVTSLLCAEGADFFGEDGAHRFARVRPALPGRHIPYFQFDTPEAARALCARHVGGCLALVRAPRSGHALDAALDRFASELGLFGPLRARRGATFASVDQVERWLWSALRLGLQPALAAFDEGSLEVAVSGMARALGRARLVDVRPRLVGCLMTNDAQVERLAELGAAVTTLPVALDARHPASARLHQTLGAAGVMALLSHRRLLDAGVLWSIGSASPQPTSSLLDAAQHAVQHPDPAQRVTVYEALAAITVDGARTGFDEAERGTLTLGKRADLIVLDRDPLAPGARLTGLALEATYVSGRRHEQRPLRLSRLYLGALAGRLRESWGP